jgi:hypothetical protein
MRPIRVLHDLGAMDRGGSETWLLCVLRHINRERIGSPGENPGSAPALGRDGNLIGQCNSPVQLRKTNVISVSYQARNLRKAAEVIKALAMAVWRTTRRNSKRTTAGSCPVTGTAESVS